MGDSDTETFVFHQETMMRDKKIANPIGILYCMTKKRHNLAEGDNALTGLPYGGKNLDYVQRFLSCNLCALTRWVCMTRCEKNLFSSRLFKESIVSYCRGHKCFLQIGWLEQDVRIISSVRLGFDWRITVDWLKP